MGTELLVLTPVIKCLIMERVSRFVVTVECLGKVAPALNTNTGRLPNLLVSGRVAYCMSKSSGKTTYRLLGVEVGGGVALTDVYVQSMSFEKALELGAIPWLGNCVIARRNPAVRGSRLDYLLKCSEEQVWVELKSALLIHEDGLAGYPDCPSLRGRRHVKELTRLAREGRKALLIFVAAIPGVKGFKPYGLGDPKIPELIKEAIEAGVIVKAVGISGTFKDGSLTTTLWCNDLPIYL